jgi:hypothetical protein
MVRHRYGDRGGLASLLHDDVTAFATNLGKSMSEKKRAKLAS